jgi:hypothetical protein
MNDIWLENLMVVSIIAILLSEKHLIHADAEVLAVTVLWEHMIRVSLSLLNVVL